MSILSDVIDIAFNITGVLVTLTQKYITKRKKNSKVFSDIYNKRNVLKRNSI